MSSVAKAILAGATLLALATVVLVASSSTPSLPADFLGRWYMSGSGGGVEGIWADSTGGGYVVITAANESEYYDAGGALLTTSSFEPPQGASIFSAEEEWILDEESPVPRVIRLLPDGALSISDHVYDDFGSTYRRAP